ncbi:MAG: hypothetical protein AAFY01_08250 [Pseudomonadota bacterium]
MSVKSSFGIATAAAIGLAFGTASVISPALAEEYYEEEVVIEETYEEEIVEETYEEEIIEETYEEEIIEETYEE